MPANDSIEGETDMLVCRDCGSRLTFDRSVTRIDCDCGASYAVTVTQLTGAGDRVGP